MIFQVVDHFERDRRQQANIASLTNARGWTNLQRSFAGEDSKPVEERWLYPFPDEGQGDRYRISKRTAQIFAKLESQGLLQPKFVGAIAAADLLDEIESLMKE